MNRLIFLFSYWAKNVHFHYHCIFPWFIFVIFLSFPFYLYSIFLSSFLPDHNWSYHWSHAQARMKPSHWNYHLLFICLFSNGGNWFDRWDYHFLLICKSVFFSCGKLLTWQIHYKTTPRSLGNSPKGSSYSVFKCVQVSDIWVSNLILFGLRQILLVNVSDVFWHWHSR